MSLLVIILWGLLVLKLGWNVLIPVALQRRAMDGSEEGISMAPFIELFVLLLLVIASALSPQSDWWCRWPTALGLGLGSIIFSYVLMIVLGFLVRPKPS